MSAPPSTIVSIDGPGMVAVDAPPTPADVCLSMGDPFNPSVGQTQWSLQPCTVSVPVVEDLRVHAVPTAAPAPPSLPVTGAGPVLIGVTGLVLLVGVLALVASRRKLERRPPRCSQSPGRPHGLLVEASVPVESGAPTLLLPVREVSCTPSRARDVVEGRTSPSRVAVLHHAMPSAHVQMGEEFVDGWDGGEADWCPPRGVARPVGLVR